MLTINALKTLKKIFAPKICKKNYFFYFSCTLKDSCKTIDLDVRTINFELIVSEEARNSKCSDKEMVCCHEEDKIESLVNISDESGPQEDYEYEYHYEYEDESDQCEMYFAGASFGSLKITQQEKDEHLTYE